MTLVGATILLALRPIAALGADVTGTWSAQMVGPNGEAVPMSFTRPTSNGMMIGHEGTINGEEMKLKVKAEQGELPNGEMTLKPAK